MATRSLIGKQNSDGTITSIYCHWDGQPQHNGTLLQNFYNTPFKVDQLLSLGNLSYLGSEIGDMQDFDNPTNRDWCLSYRRDRGEDNQNAVTTTRESFFKDNGWTDYYYIYNLDGEWECYNFDKQMVAIP